MKNFFKNEDGVTSIEYALLAAALAIVVSGALYILGGSISKLFASIGLPK